MTKEEMRGLVGRALGGRLLTVEFRGGKRMRTTVEVIGPEQAAKYLERNEGNRPLRKSTVERYADAMTRGQWMLTHEAIAFNINGELINGQHRLAAVVASGATVSFTVARGVDPGTFQVIDSGIKRSTGDRLHQVGMPYTNVVPSALRYLIMYEKAPDVRWVGNLMSRIATDQDVLKLADEIGYDLLAEAGSLSQRASAPDVRLPRSSAMAAYLLFKQADPEGEKQQAFWDGVISGVNLDRDDPRLALRRWAANAGTGYYKGQKALVALVKAWNAFLKGESIRLIKWLPGESMPQPLMVVDRKAAATR